MTQHASALIYLRLKGFAKPDALGDHGAALIDAKLAEAAKLGLRLTAVGRVAADAAWTDERSTADAAALEAAHSAFAAINTSFKTLVSDWQLRDGAPNDHSDAAYDAAILVRLRAVHDQLLTALRLASAQVPRLGRYAPAFGDALTKLESGERRWMAAPVIDSYHSLWFEFHEEIIRLTGRTRSAEAAAGTAA